MSDIFVPDGQQPEDPLWLTDHPPWRDELLRPCVEAFTSPGDLLLDPFARHGALLRAGQAAGRRVLATNADPLPLLEMRLTLCPPEPRRLDSIFSRLADTPHRDKTLFRYLDDRYLVHCPACDRPQPAEYMIWEDDVPVEKAVHCAECGQQELAQITSRDLDLQAAVDPQELTYWRLHQRLADPDGPSDVRDRVGELLHLYTARNRTVLAELMLQAEALFLGDEPALDIIRGLCLASLQRSHSLHRTPQELELPRVLYQPRRFVERNAWRVFEEAYRRLRQQSQPVSLTWARDLDALLQPGDGPASGQALTWQRTTRELQSALRGRYRFRLICADPPRPHPTAHALAFLWSGWLFGRAAARPLLALASRTFLDWQWYTESMVGVLRLLHSLLADGGRLALAFTTDDHEMLPALLLAAARGELALEQSVHQIVDSTARGDRVAYRLLFRRPFRPVHRLPTQVGTDRDLERELGQDMAPDPQEEGRAAAQEALELRAEPAPVSWLALPVCARWSKLELLATADAESGRAKPLAWLMGQLETVLPPEGPLPKRLLRLGPPRDTADKARMAQMCWWLASTPAQTPLSERVEQAALELLQETLTWPEHALYDELCQRFRGLATPERRMLQAVIRSYGQELSSGYWQLRAEDWPSARARVHGQMLELLERLGLQLGYSVWLAPSERAHPDPGRPGSDGPESAAREEWASCSVVWHEGDQAACGFALSDTAALSPFLTPPHPALVNASRYAVVPGGRAGLLAFKLSCWPEFGRLLARSGWMLVKQRHVRSLARMEDLDRPAWRDRIVLDAITERVDEQLALL
jgi:hypothetical protein